MRKSITFACGLLLIGIVASVAADSSKPLGTLVQDLPHEKLNANITELDYLSYGKSLAPVVGPGFVLSFLSILVGIVYGIIKLCCCICCSSKDDDEKKYNLTSRLIPGGIYVVILLWILAGCIIGWVSNGKFDKGLTALTNSVEGTGNEAVGIANNVLDHLTNISSELPGDLQGILDQVSGVPQISADIAQIGRNVNSTNDQVYAIENQVKAMDAYGNLTVLQSLDAELTSISNKSSEAIGSVVDLTTQISDNINTVLQEQLSKLPEQLATISEDVNEIIKSSNEFMDAAEDMVKQINKYVGQVRDGNDKRSKVMSAIYAAAFVSSAFAVLGWFVIRGFPFHITAGLGFVFSFLLWFSGSVHLLLAIVTSDVCGIVDDVVTSFTPDGQAGAAINGCMNDVSLFQALNLTSKFSFDEVRGYQAQFNNFSSFMSDFNFSAVDGYMNSAASLKKYNLTETANNLTVADFGWSEQNVYDGLNDLNTLTVPQNREYSLQNYTTLDISDFSSDQPAIQAAWEKLDALVHANITIFNQTENTKRELIATQYSIDVLMANLTTYQNDYDEVKVRVNDLQTKNITTANNIIGGMLAQIEEFFTLGDCSFVHDAYNDILGAICSMMEPAIELLMAASYMIALGLFPTIILVEVLAKRVTHPGDDDKVHPDKEYYTYNDEPSNNKAISMGVRTQE